MTSSVTSSPATRLVRGFGALSALVAAVLGIPWLLVQLAGNPLPSELSTGTLWRTVTTPDDGTALIGLVALIAWIAWLVFTVSVIVELVAALSRQQVQIRLPGLTGAQRLAGTLIMLVLAAVVVPHPVTSAAPVEPGPPAGAAPVTPGPGTDHHAPVETSADRRPPGQNADAAADTRQAALVHVVRPGDDLWTLAEHYYGDGTAWRRIARANPAVLTGGPDRLQPGWRLRIPGVEPGSHHVRVRAGETLSSIAEREYGDASQWTRIYHANRSRIEDPDMIPIGLVLALPANSAEKPAADRREDEPTSGPDTTSTTEPDRPQSRHPDAPEPDPKTPDPSASTTPATSAPHTTPDPSPTSDRGGKRTVERPDERAAESEGVDGADQDTTTAPGLAGIGGVLAAALITGLLARRRIQLQVRPVGRRIPQPPPGAQQLETGLGRRQNPLGLEQLDLALRAIGRDCRRRGSRLPALLAARLDRDELLLRMTRPDLPAPVGFNVSGPEWLLSAEDAGYLLQETELTDAPQPYPALTSVGTDDAGRTVMINIEFCGALTITGAGHRLGHGAVTAMATELAFSPWADEVVITLVGDDDGLAGAIDRYNVSRLGDLDQLLDRWEHRALLQRRNLDEPAAGVTPTAGDLRIDPDRADPWVPEVALILVGPDDGQAARLERLVLAEPRATLGAVLLGDRAIGRWQLRIDDPAADEPAAKLEPLGWRLSPQSVIEPAAGVLRQLIGCTGSHDTDPAPWWAEDFPPGTPRPTRARPEHPPDDEPRASAGAGDSVGDPSRGPGSARHQRSPALATSWPSAAASSGAGVDERSPIEGPDPAADRLPVAGRAESEESVTAPNPYPGVPVPAPRHPTVLLLGPIQLIGAAGTPPSRATLQCIEYCTWLLEHPGSTARAMTAGLVVAEGTRRSNMSRLRTWLGADDRGEPYLPDAYSGRIVLSPLVSSDWHRLQILTATGINRTGTEALCRALELVRGAPLADAAPGQWHWAEEMRTDMVSVVRDIGVELADRALAASDIDLARWAAARSLTAAPQDEFLLGARIRTEHQAGNPAEVERLTLQLAAHGRALGIDLHPETVDLLQQVMEGRLRARA